MTSTSFTPTALVAGVQLTASIQSYYTVPVLSTVGITGCVAYNSDTVAHVVTLYLVTNASEGSNQNIVVKQSIPPGASMSLYQALNQVLAAGSTIQASCDADSVVALRVSGNLYQ